jgi:hypothetical protein
MVAGLLHKHGVWIGRARSTMYPGSNTPLGTENQDIKAVLKDTMMLNGYSGWRQWPLPESPKGQTGFKDKILSCVDTDGPWLIKTARLLWFWPLFVEAFPAAKWVFPLRPVDDVLSSIKRHPGLRKKKDRAVPVRQIVMEHFCRQGQIMSSVEHSHTVNCDDLGQGFLFEAEKLVKFAGLEYSKEITAGWIDPSMWHGGVS